MYLMFQSMKRTLFASFKKTTKRNLKPWKKEVRRRDFGILEQVGAEKTVADEKVEVDVIVIVDIPIKVATMV
jgi:hypothetical protein